MNKIGMTWDVKPEHWEEYKEIHLNAADEWPELLEMFASKGVHNFQCFAFNSVGDTEIDIPSADKWFTL